MDGGGPGIVRLRPADPVRDVPDGRSFRLSDVPAATTSGSVAAEIVEQYSEGADRPVTIVLRGPTATNLSL